MSTGIIASSAYLAARKKQEETTPESATTFTYAGWAELIKDLQVKTPEEALKLQMQELEAKWKDIVKPHSPITPEEAATSAFQFEVAANLAHVGLVALITGIEAAGLGQIETPAFLAGQNPGLGAMFDAARQVRLSYFNASFIKALQYHVNAQFQPTVVPQETLMSAYAMGLISETVYKGQMLYHGYTLERSSLMAKTQIKMPDVGMILDMLRRGILTPGGAVDWLKLQRIPEATANAIVQLRTPLLDLQSLQELFNTGQLSGDAYAERLTKHGFTMPEIMLMTRLGWKFPDVETLNQLYWRGSISREDYLTALRRQRLLSPYPERIAVLLEKIPPSGDLVQMVVREAFDPAMVTPAPGEFAKYMVMQGFSKEWSDRYWTAHWMPIALAQAYRNLHRGYWDKTKFMRALHIADVHPMWREDIFNVAFEPPGIREMGYGYDVGVYKREDIIKYRRWGGLSPEDAEKAADSLIAYRTEAEREAVRREFLYLYAKERISKADFEQALKRLGTAPAALPLWIERADLYKERLRKSPVEAEPRGITASEAVWAYEHELRSEAWLKETLQGLDYTADRVQLIMDSAKQRLTEKELVADAADLEAERRRLRDNAKSDFIKGYIVEADLRKTLTTLGYPQDLVNYMVQDAAEDRQRRHKDLLVDLYVDAYVKTLIGTEGELTDRLQGILVDEEAVSLTVDQAYVRRYQKPRGAVGG